MVDLALRSLVHDKPRFAITVAGVAFAVTLVFVQVGLFLGLLSNASVSIENTDAELWITPPNTPNVDFSRPFSEDYVDRVRSIPGVARADNLIVFFMQVALPTGASESVVVYALEDFRRWNIPWRVLEGDVSDLRRPGGSAWGNPPPALLQQRPHARRVGTDLPPLLGEEHRPGDEHLPHGVPGLFGRDRGRGADALYLHHGTHQGVRDGEGHRRLQRGHLPDPRQAGVDRCRGRVHPGRRAGLSGRAVHGTGRAAVDHPADHGRDRRRRDGGAVRRCLDGLLQQGRQHRPRTRLPHMSRDDRNVLQAYDVTKVFENGRAEPVRVLAGVSLTLARGEIVALEGPSGSGKTTLLSVLGCILSPSAGKVVVDGTRVDSCGPRELAAVRRRAIGFVFQQFNLFPSLTALENVEYALNIKGMGGPAARREAEGVLTAVGLADRKDFLPRDLSGGQMQRVAVARALAARPPVLLADEPTANLDSHAGGQILDLFRRLVKQENQALLIDTHDPQVRTICDRVIQIRDGRLIPDVSLTAADALHTRDSRYSCDALV